MNIVLTKDYELIARLNEEVQSIHAALYPDLFKGYEFGEISRFYQRIIDNPNYMFLLGEHEGQHIGYAWIEIKDYAENAFRKSYKSIYVHNIAVLEKYRKQRYGNKLSEKVEQIAADANIGRIELDYWSDNRQAKEFYQKNGFSMYREFVYKQL